MNDNKYLQKKSKQLFVPPVSASLRILYINHAPVSQILHIEQSAREREREKERDEVGELERERRGRRDERKSKREKESEK